LSYNKLTSLPGGIGFLVRLNELMLSHNQLVELPTDLVNLRSKLLTLDFTFYFFQLFPFYKKTNNLSIQWLSKSLLLTRGNVTRGNEIRGNEIRGNVARENGIRGHVTRGNVTQGNEIRENLTRETNHILDAMNPFSWLFWYIWWL
jgi:hypothetical protein